MKKPAVNDTKKSAGAEIARITAEYRRGALLRRAQPSWSITARRFIAPVLSATDESQVLPSISSACPISPNEMCCSRPGGKDLVWSARVHVVVEQSSPAWRERSRSWIARSIRRLSCQGSGGTSPSSHLPSDRRLRSHARRLVSDSSSPRREWQPTGVLISVRNLGAFLCEGQAFSL
jgi:hypothetical protein